MTQRALTRATYADVLAAPEHLVAEIVDGELSLSPRPSPRHADAASVLGMDLGKNTEPLSSQFVLRPVPAILKSAMNASPSLKSILKEVKERDEGSGRLADKAKRIELRRREIEGL